MSANNATQRVYMNGSRVEAGLAVLAGMIVFCLAFGFGVLNPESLNWLAAGDPSQSYLGWAFFRHSPWTFPLGAVPAMGMEQSSSIVYTDSIPAFALLFKLCRGLLPADFQYIGLWLCCCYALQGYFSYRLLSQFTRSRTALLTGVLLFLLSPIMLLRATGHFALSAHWVIVCALYLYYQSTSPRHLAKWLLLLWFVPLVHAYLMFMVYAIWAAYLLRFALFDRQLPLLRAACLVPLSIAGTVAVMWSIGYFGDMAVSTYGFGYYSMNLLSPWIPLGGYHFLLWKSHLLRVLLLSPALHPATAGQSFEGFNYLGFGVIAALPFVVISWMKTRQRFSARGWHDILRSADLALLTCGLCLGALALSNVVTFGSYTLFRVPVPSRLDLFVNIFRSSGRLFWPVYYMLLMAVARGVARWPLPASRIAFVAILVLQMLDLSPFFRTVHDSAVLKEAFAKFPPFDSPFWRLARQRYSNIYVIPGSYKGDEYIGYEYLATKYGFHIDTVFYARLPAEEHQRARTLRHQAFWGGELDPNGLYLIQATSAEKFRTAQAMFSPVTGVGMVDGFNVVAPKWLEQADAPYLQQPAKENLPSIVLGHVYRFDKQGDGIPFLFGGWGDAEDTAVWSLGPVAGLAMHRPLPLSDVHISLQMAPYLPAAYPRLGVRVELAGHLLAQWEFRRNEAMPELSFDVPASLQGADGNIALVLHFDAPRSPKDAGENVDTRPIAVMLSGMQMQQK